MPVSLRNVSTSVAVRRASGADLRAARALVERRESDTGERPLNDQQWLDLEHADPGLIAAVLPDGERIVAYAQASRAGTGWSIALVEASASLDDDARAALLGALLDGIAASGGGEVTWWSTDPSSGIEALADAVGLTDRRRLLQLRRPLPTGMAVHIPTRPFVVGVDELAWLSVNGRAFASHPEQGAWDIEALRLREAEGWFDPQGFLLHERDGRLAGFCWTKVHATAHPPLGEIYVIAVDPDFGRQGLGRELTLAGLEHLAAAGLRWGMLYVDATNAGAVAMYEQLGFHLHRSDVACIGRVDAAGRSVVDLHERSRR